MAVGKAAFGEGSGKIFLNNLVCNGTEKNLVQCSRKDNSTETCDHSEDASVVCASKEIVELILVRLFFILLQVHVEMVKLG